MTTRKRRVFDASLKLEVVRMIKVRISVIVTAHSGAS